jgi:hypothetical protein
MHLQREALSPTRVLHHVGMRNVNEPPQVVVDLRLDALRKLEHRK